MSNRPVSVSKYQQRWKDDFQQLKKMYADHLGDLVIEIHHVGSTSVVGLAAKPRIDIDIEINRDDYEKVEIALEELGYEYQNLGIIDRHSFKYMGTAQLPAHNMYVCPSDSRELARHLTFRDYLRTHEDEMKRYSAIKLDAIAKGADHINEYMDYKGKVVGEILVKALNWKGIAPGYQDAGIERCEACESDKLTSSFGIRYQGGGDKREYITINCGNCSHKWEYIFDEY